MAIAIGSPVPEGNPGSSLAFTVDAIATLGTYQVAITAAGAGVSPQSTSLTLVIVPGPAPPISVSFIFDDLVFTVVGDTWTWPGVSIARGAGYGARWSFPSKDYPRALPPASIRPR